MKTLLLLSAFFLAGCAALESKPTADDLITLEGNPEAAQKLMCVEEHIGVLRHSRAYLEEFCPQIKSQFELICFRVTHSTKDWRKACPGIDTVDKLECMTTVQNGPGYALLESLQKCKTVTNRRQVFCLSKKAAHSGVPLQPETVQECLDKNAG